MYRLSLPSDLLLTCGVLGLLIGFTISPDKLSISRKPSRCPGSIIARVQRRVVHPRGLGGPPEHSSFVEEDRHFEDRQVWDRVQVLLSCTRPISTASACPDKSDRLQTTLKFSQHPPWPYSTPNTRSQSPEALSSMSRTIPTIALRSISSRRPARSFAYHYGARRRPSASKSLRPRRSGPYLRTLSGRSSISLFCS